MNACGVLIFDARATSAQGRVVIRPCGAPARYVISMGGDSLFATCHRHNARLERAGVHRPKEATR